MLVVLIKLFDSGCGAAVEVTTVIGVESDEFTLFNDDIGFAASRK
ncbi:hypothetical protein MASR1M12_37430 [Erysipelotrichia bacterium]